MTCMIAIAALAGVFFCLQPAQAYEAPWCAVLTINSSTVIWDCQYRSIVAGAITARTTSRDPQSRGRPGNVALVRTKTGAGQCRK